MARIGLISCTSRKKSYQCPARELYSESPRFRLAYNFAKLVADKIFILSAKHGLIPEEQPIAPYNETLKDKSAMERREWAVHAPRELRKVADPENDEFIVIAGEAYHEHLLPHLNHVWLPLKGKMLGEWIPELERLIRLEKETDKAANLHMLFNGLPRLDWTMIDKIPYRNGIYIMFEKGETYLGLDRIVRVGTHRGQDRLKQRLKNHFVIENADGSIFRKNIGRAMLNKAADPYLEIWELETSRTEQRMKYGRLVNEQLETELEEKISQYLRENITFACFPVEDGKERLRLEAGIIATLNAHHSFGPSNHWFGLNSPIQEIAQSGLWNRQGLNGHPLSDDELDRIKQLVRFGNARPPHRAFSKSVAPNSRISENAMEKANDQIDQTIIKLGNSTSQKIRQYIDELLCQAKRQGKEFIDLVSGDIHKALKLKHSMPLVCDIMYKKMLPEDEILHTTPSGKSSTIKIRYILTNR